MSNTVTVNHLEVAFSVLAPRISDTGDFATQVVLANRSPTGMRLDTLALDNARRRLQVRQISGAPVYSGPLGMPSEDDGETGRKVLQPGGFLFYKFTGWDYFGSALAPGRYQVRFRYQNDLPHLGDWTGTVETEWLDFEVLPKKRP